MLWSYTTCTSYCVRIIPHGGAVGCGTALRVGRSWVRLTMLSLEFFIDIILSAALCIRGRLSLQQKWVPRIFPGCKGGRCVELKTFPHSRADCLEIWEPQTPGNLRACTRVALPLIHAIPRYCTSPHHYTRLTTLHKTDKCKSSIFVYGNVLDTTHRFLIWTEITLKSQKFHNFCKICTIHFGKLNRRG